MRTIENQSGTNGTQAPTAAWARPGSSGLRELLNGVFFSYKLILATFFIPVSFSFLLSLSLTETFVSEAKMLVLLGRQHIPGQSLATAGFGGALNMQARIVRAEAQILGSNELLESVIREMKPESVYPKLARSYADSDDAKLISSATERLEQDLAIDLSSDTDIIHLSFEHRSGEVAATVLDRMIALYLDRRRTIFADEGTRILEQRLEGFEKEIEEIASQIEDIRGEAGISDFPIQRAALLRRQAALEEAAIRSETLVKGLGARVDELELLMELIPEEIEVFADDGESSALNTAINTLNRLERERSRLLKIYRPDSQVVAETQTQIDNTKAALETLRAEGVGRTRQGRNSTYDRLLQESISLQAQQRAEEAQLEQQLLSIDDTIIRTAELEEVELTYNKLRLKQEILIEKVKQYESRLEKERLAQRLESIHEDPTIRIIERASIPTEGKSARTQVIVVGFLGGIILSIAAVYLTTIGRSIMVTPEEAQRTMGLPVLVSINKA